MTATRIAQPDEVWNYQRGDGLEKAICLANILKSRNLHLQIDINIEKDHVALNINEDTITWPTQKGLNGLIRLDGNYFHKLLNKDL